MAKHEMHTEKQGDILSSLYKNPKVKIQTVEIRITYESY